jgi:hypothetical protein
MRKIMAFGAASAALVAMVGVTAASADTGSGGGGGANYHALNPSRIADTRKTVALGAGKVLRVKVAGVGGVPTSGAAAAELDVTATGAEGKGYLAAYPDGSARSGSSTLNFTKGVSISNTGAVTVGASGYVDIYTSAATDVVVDVDGYYAAAPVQTVSLTTASALNGGQTVLTHVGGKIGDPGFATPLTSEVTLPAGTYQYTLYADFSREAGTGSDNPAGNSTYGSAFLWADVDGNTSYDWKTGESLGGTVQTGAVPVDPTGSIEQPANGTGIFTLTTATKVQVGGFAYNTNTGSYGTTGQPGAGDFSFLGATASFVKLNVG